MKILMAFFICCTFFFSCKDATVEFNEQLVKINDEIIREWGATVQTISMHDTISAIEFIKIAELKKFTDLKIKEVTENGVVAEGKALQKAMLNQLNYLSASCVAYKKIFDTKPRKFTKRESLEWLANSEKRFNYYGSIIEEEQRKFANEAGYILR